MQTPGKGCGGSTGTMPWLHPSGADVKHCPFHVNLGESVFPFCIGVGNVGISVVPLPAVRAKLKTCVSQRDGHQRLSPSNSAVGWSDMTNKKALSPLMYKSLSSVYLNKTAGTYPRNRLSGKFWVWSTSLLCGEKLKSVTWLKSMVQQTVHMEWSWNSSWIFW